MTHTPRIPWRNPRFAVIVSDYALRASDQSVLYHVAAPAFLQHGLFSYAETLCRDRYGVRHSETTFRYASTPLADRQLCPACAQELRELSELEEEENNNATV